jgi:hypothetical protein
MSTKISQLTSATDITASDLMQIVDVEDGVMAPSGTNKKITAQLLADDLAGIVSDGSIATSKLASGELPSGVTVSSTNIVNGSIVDADVSASALIAGSKVSPSFTAPSVISVTSSSDALRITQTGAGNALVVEDSTNPDSTPFVVTGNGDVGIGTSSPQAPLDIANCGIRINAGRQISSNLDNSGLLVFGGTAGNGANIELYGGSHAISPSHTYIDANVISIRSADGASGKMLIDSTGNVGIGTSSPSSKLHLTSSDAGWPSGITLENTAASRKFALSTRLDASIPARFSISDETALAERVSILGSNGNVGIGIDTPSSKLHVTGDLTMSSASVATSATAGANGDVPAQVAGYLVVNINGTSRKIPYYA